jgi:hypothetical protein
VTLLFTGCLRADSCL